jgi:hypothetical protein
MALTQVPVGDNPQQPSISDATYIPDQLIAGDLKLVTDGNATLTGGVALVRGTVLGQVVDGAAATAAGVQATGTLTFSGNPAIGETITLNGTVVTFIANNTAASAGQVALGLTEAQTIEALMAYLVASTDTQLVKFLYSASGQVITLTAATGGTGGNSLTVAETSSVIVASGATLSGGVSNTGNGTFGAITLGPNVKLGAYKLACIQATTGTPAATGQAAEGNVGTGVLSGITAGAGTLLGEYSIVLTATGATAAFDVINPQGAIVGVGNVATAYNSGGLAFTLSNAGTMTKGDTWLILVTDNGVALFSVVGPTGIARPNVTVGTAYADELAFTLSQGGTKFVVGDAFTLTVAPGSGKYKLCVATAVDGSQIPNAILVDDADATGGDVNCGVYQMGEFNATRITFDPSWTVAGLSAQLRRVGIFLKNVVSAIDPL